MRCRVERIEDEEDEEDEEEEEEEEQKVGRVRRRQSRGFLKGFRAIKLPLAQRGKERALEIFLEGDSLFFRRDNKAVQHPLGIEKMDWIVM